VKGVLGWCLRGSGIGGGSCSHKRIVYVKWGRRQTYEEWVGGGQYEAKEEAEEEEELL
jgi:hypothetical protein